MSQRKSWTQMEDKILKLLRLQCGDKKWSQIAELMKNQYGIQGRNGKQCRQRYHNHLDQRISKSNWKPEEDQLLLTLHNKYGNRWAHIARSIPGRTDNCVKNRFYSRFRKSIRVINQMIKIFWRKQFKTLKITFITKIIQLTQQLRDSQDQNKIKLFQISQDLKCKLMNFSDCTEETLRSSPQRMASLSDLIKDINNFNKKNKRRGKKKKKENNQEENEDQILIDVKLKNKKISRPKKINKNLVQNIKIQPVIELEPVKNDLEKLIKTQFEIIQKFFQAKNQQHAAQYFTSFFPLVDSQKPFHQVPDIIEQIDDKIYEQFQFNNEIAEEGFDINQFYSLENLHHRENFYFQ